MSKPIVFISHITEEKELAISLKNYLEKKFLKSIEVFASSHEDSVGLGDEWINTVKTSLKKCNLEIVLCSPLSVGRPWINFEAGGGWVREIPVVPLCHSGLTPGELPIPLKTLQGGQISQKPDIEKLFKKIAAINDIATPSIDDSEFFKVVTDFESKIKGSLLAKDTLAVFNLLAGNVELLKYSIVSSTTEINDINKIQIENISNYKIEFKKLGNLYNISLLMMFHQEKVFEVFYRTINKLSDDIKFILTHKSLTLSPELIDLLNSFLFQVKNADTWISYFNVIGKHNKKMMEHDQEWLKSFETVPEKRHSNAINYFIDYYNSLVFYQIWTVLFDNIVQKIIPTDRQNAR